MFRIVFALLLVFAPLHSFGWGKRGHDVICHIAECNLTSRTKARVEELLSGRSMVYFGNWLDSASRTERYANTYTWHYFNLGLRDEIVDAEREPKGDLLSALEQLERTLRSENVTISEQSFALKAYIHLVGDAHQPLHLGRREDRGGGEIPVVYFVESTSLHAVWDYHIVDGSHSWSYTEWQQQIDRLTAAEERSVVEGDYAQWMDATHKITREIYRSTPEGSRIYYEYVDHFALVVEQQLLYAGLRLASKLNDIFDGE